MIRPARATLRPNVVLEPPAEERSAAGGRSAPSTGWAATPKPHPRIRTETQHRAVAVYRSLVVCADVEWSRLVCAGYQAISGHGRQPAIQQVYLTTGSSNAPRWECRHTLREGNHWPCGSLERTPPRTKAASTVGTRWSPELPAHHSASLATAPRAATAPGSWLRGSLAPSARSPRA